MPSREARRRNYARTRSVALDPAVRWPCWRRPFYYAHRVSAGERWTDEAVIRESERWVYVPPDGVRLEDERRLLVHLPKRRGQSRVWRSSAPDEETACELIGETIGTVRSFGGGGLVWHTGEGVSPAFMDECLAKCGFETTEELDVLAFFLVDGLRERLPRLGITEGVSAELVRDVDSLREALLIDSEVFSSPSPSGEEFAEYAGEREKLGLLEHGEALQEGTSLALRFLAFVDGVSGRGIHARKTVGAAGAQIVGETLRLWGTVITLFVARYADVDPLGFWKRLGLPSFCVLMFMPFRLEHAVFHL
jgi:hypothetical protein